MNIYLHFQNIKKVLELERCDRQNMETSALKLISENKVKIERNFNNQVRELNSRIEELNDKLTESHTMNNELISKLDRTKIDLEAANKEIEKLKILESDLKNNMAEVRKNLYKIMYKILEDEVYDDGKVGSLREHTRRFELWGVLL